LDIACADGVMTREISSRFPDSFKSLVGVDISPKMIEAAISLTKHDDRVSFSMKDRCPETPFDIILGLGYLSAKNYEGEMGFLLKRLSLDGTYLCTFSSRDSLHARIKLKDEQYLEDYRNYEQYREMLGRFFHIQKEIPYGFFIPKLWSFPFLGRALQPAIDVLFKAILSRYFHEKVYVLKRKESIC